MISDAHHPKATRVQDRGSSRFGNWIVVGVAIDLDDQPALGTKEIGDIGANPDLASELGASDLPIAEHRP